MYLQPNIKAYGRCLKMTSIPWAADWNQILYNLLKANAYQNSVHVLALSNVSVFLDEYNLNVVTLRQEKDADWSATVCTSNVFSIYRTTWEKCLLSFLHQDPSLCAAYFPALWFFLKLISDFLTSFKISIFYRLAVLLTCEVDSWSFLILLEPESGNFWHSLLHSNYNWLYWSNSILQVPANQRPGSPSQSLLQHVMLESCLQKEAACDWRWKATSVEQLSTQGNLLPAKKTGRVLLWNGSSSWSAHSFSFMSFLCQSVGPKYLWLFKWTLSSNRDKMICFTLNLIF